MSSVRERSVAKLETTYVHQQEYAEIASARKRKLLIRRMSVFLVLTAVIFYFMISGFISQTSSLEAMHAKREQLNQELAELNKQQGILKEDIIKLNDDEYIAKLARKELYFSEEGEIIFSIPD